MTHRSPYPLSPPPVRPDPEPLAVPPEPVRRHEGVGDRGYIDGRGGGLAFVALVGAALVIVGLALLVGSSIAAPSSAQHSGITSTGLAARSGAPLGGECLEPGDGYQLVLSVVGTCDLGLSLRRLTTGGAPPTLDGPVVGATVAAPALQRTGWATWYDDGPGLYAAAPSWRFGDEPYAVQVCGFEGGRTSCVLVTVRDFCACGNRHGIPTVIDLSPAAFRALAPLSAGVIRVTVDHVRERVPAAPATDVR